MTVKTEEVSRVSQHTVYRTANGDRVPGVTTILRCVNKGEGLIRWHNDMGLAGVDTKKYVDKLADAGTLAHLWIHRYLLDGLDPSPEELASFTPEQVSLAQNSVLKFMEWERQHKVRALWGERPLVSETWRFGGTIDLLCEIDGTVGICDIKTAKAIYDDHLYQVGGYCVLAEEHGLAPAWARIIQVGRTEDEGFDVRYKPWGEMAPFINVFHRARELYLAMKAARG